MNPASAATTNSAARLTANVEGSPGVTPNNMLLSALASSHEISVPAAIPITVRRNVPARIPR